jgi:CRISPR-associated protein Cmr3
LPFPFPSTLAGAVRNRAGLDGEGRFQYANDKEALQSLKRLKVRGPFLIERTDERQGAYSWLLPAPHDVLLFEKEEGRDPDQKRQYDLKHIAPLTLPEKALTDFEALPPTCTLAGLPMTPKGKATDGPTYWRWDFFKRWLTNPDTLIGLHEEDAIGHQGLERELRVHIAMNPARGAAQDEALFDTSGMEFTRHEKELSGCHKLALVALVDEEQTKWEMKAGLGSLGSERRLVTWRQGQKMESIPFVQEMLQAPNDIVEAIANAGGCRLVLLTPAYFQQGYTTDWRRFEQHAVTPELRAMVVKRPQVVSGWDIATGTPKPSTRLAPAGSVYYLSLQGSTEAIKTWVREMWLQPISDEQPEQFCNDGFGVAVMGAWSGNPAEIKKERE